MSVLLFKFISYILLVPIKTPFVSGVSNPPKFYGRKFDESAIVIIIL